MGVPNQSWLLVTIGGMKIGGAAETLLHPTKDPSVGEFQITDRRPQGTQEGIELLCSDHHRGRGHHSARDGCCDWGRRGRGGTR